MKHPTSHPTASPSPQHLSRHRVLGCLLLLLTMLSFAPHSDAQVVVRLKMSKRTYLLHEPVTATVYITNHAGRQLILRREGSRSWLNFHLTSKGRTIPPARIIDYKPVVIPAGQTVARSVTLSNTYSLGRMGDYACSCSVNMPGSTRNGFSSNRVLFTISYGRTVWVQRAGIPKMPGQTREYKLITFSGNGINELYAEVSSVNTGLNIATIPLGSILTFRKPQGTFDAQNNLHALYQVKPNIFTHTCISPTGKVKFSVYHKRGRAGGDPRLVFVAGAVRVAGSVPYNPAAERAVQKKIHNISERPPFIYR